LSKKRICLLSSGHSPFDERIFWKFAKSFQENEFSVSIFCSTLQIDKVVDGISIKSFDGSDFSKNKKAREFYSLISKFKPELIMSFEMLPVFPALKFRNRNKSVKVVLDITEWYPDNVALKFTGFKRWLKYFQLFIPYLFILQRVDHLIIGELAKKKRYDLLAPSKSNTIIRYYPVLKYFNYQKPDLSKDEIVLGYAGVITFERGINQLLNAAVKLSYRYPQKKFTLLLFGRFTYKEEENEFKSSIATAKNLKIEFADWIDYDKMSSIIEKLDLCFDLRNRNFIFRNSLPIKIFEYMACGKPFIYSDIKPIKDELEFSKYGSLVNPENEIEIIEAVKKYLNNPQLAIEHSENARDLIEKGKNWESESRKLIELVNKLLS